MLRAKVLIDTKGMVDIDHVKFGYTPEKEIIHDLRLHADPGQLVAIVGPTGAGKTTIINLLMRFYDVNEGVISVDGYPIRNLTREQSAQSVHDGAAGYLAVPGHELRKTSLMPVKTRR